MHTFYPPNRLLELMNQTVNFKIGLPFLCAIGLLLWLMGAAWAILIAIPTMLGLFVVIAMMLRSPILELTNNALCIHSSGRTIVLNWDDLREVRTEFCRFPQTWAFFPSTKGYIQVSLYGYEREMRDEIKCLFREELLNHRFSESRKRDHLNYSR